MLLGCSNMSCFSSHTLANKCNRRNSVARDLVVILPNREHGWTELSIVIPWSITLNYFMLIFLSILDYLGNPTGVGMCIFLCIMFWSKWTILRGTHEDFGVAYGKNQSSAYKPRSGPHMGWAFLSLFNNQFNSVKKELISWNNHYYAH